MAQKKHVFAYLEEREVHRDLLQENGLFLSFPYVCPEPVLVKRSFLYINGYKKTVFLPGRPCARYPG
eukprot:SAG22_NODE_16082_length_333_cov_0.760684_1_plen_66_part_10